MEPPEDLSDLIFDNAVEGVFQSTPQGRFLRVNNAMAKIFGYDSPQEMVKSIADISRQLYVTSKDRTRFKKILKEQGVVENFEGQNKRKDGSVLWTATSARAVRDRSGKITSYVGFIQDITKRKNTENALRQSEAKYRALIEHTSAVTFIDDLDKAETTLFISPQIERLTGYSPEEWVADSGLWRRSIHPEDSKRVIKEVIRTDATGKPFVIEYRLVRRNGTIVWVAENTRLVHDADGKPLYWQGTLTDITEQRQTEEHLREAESRYRTLVEQVPVAVYTDAPTDNLDNVIYISPQAETISGYPLTEWMNKRGFWPGLIHPDDLEHFVQENERTNESGQPFDVEYRIIHKDGHVVWLRDLARLARDANGQPLYWHGILIDITQQKNFQETLQQSESRFRKAFEASPIAICITRLEDGKFIDVNDAYLKLSGFRRKNLIGRLATELGFQTEEERIQWLEEFHASGGSISGQASRFITATGQALDTLAFFESIEVNGEKAILSMFYDVTVQTRMEEALRHSEARYRALVEHIPAILYLDSADNSQKTLYISPQVETVLGCTPAEWIADSNVWENSLHPEDRERILAEDRRTNETGEPFSDEYRLIARDGRVVWIQEESTLICDGDGNPLYWQGFLLDITNKKETQEALRQSELRFGRVFQSSPIGICITTLQEGQFVDVNEAYCKLTEYRREELLKHTPLALKIWESPGDRKRLHEAILDARSLKGMENKLRTKSGRLVEVMSFYELIELDGKPSIISMHYDTSSQREAQEVLREVASAYRGLFDSVSDAIYIQDREGRFLDVNLGAVKMYGYPQEFFLGKSPEILSAPSGNDLEAVKQAVELAFQGIPQHFEFWGMRKNGEIFPKEVHLYKGSYFGQDVVFALAQDITQKKLSEETLLRREALLEAIAYSSERFVKDDNWENSVPDILSRIGQASKASRVYIHKIKTGTAVELLSDLEFEWCAPGIAPQIGDPKFRNFDFENHGFTYWENGLGRGNIICDLVNNLPEKAQAELSAEGIRSLLNVPIFVGNAWWGLIGYDECAYPRAWSQPEIESLKAAASILGAVIERHQVADALSKSEEQYRTLIEQASDGIFISDRRGNYVEVNPSGCAMLGYTREEVLKLNLLNIIDKNDLARKSGLFRKIQLGQSITAEIHLIRKDGTSFPAEVSIKKMPGGRYQGMVRDITERRRAQDAQERQLKELSVLHALTVAGTRAPDEDNLIEQATEIIGYTLYPDILGFLMLTEDGKYFYPHPSFRGIVDRSQMRKYEIGMGVTGRVVSTGKPINIRNVREVENYIQVNPNTRSELCVPMIIGERVIGTINAESAQAGFFTIDDERLLLTIAGQLAPAIERLRTQRAEREQRILAEALRDIASVLNSTLEFNTVLERILENIDRVVPSKSANIMLLENERLRIIRHRGYTDLEAKEWRDSFIKNIRDVPDLEQVAKTGIPQLIADTQANPQWITFAATNWIRSHISAPILESGRVIGFVNLDSDTPGYFSERDTERLTAFTNQAATAIENARLFQAEQQRRKEAETLQEAAALITTTLERDKAIEYILEQLNRVVPYDRASVQLLNENELEIVDGRGWADLSSVIGTRFPVPGDNPNTLVIQERKPLILNHLEDHFTAIRQESNYHINSWMGIPLIVQDRAIGMLAIDSEQDNHFTEGHARLASAFANQAASAIENARLFQEESRRAKIIEALAEIANVIATTREIGVALDEIAQRSLNLLKASHVAIYLLLEDNKTLNIITAKGSYQNELLSHSLKVGVGITGNIVATGKAEIVNDTAKDPRRIRVPGTPEEDNRVESMMSAPLILRGKPIGALNAWRLRENGLFSESELTFLVSIAHQASIAIESGRLFEETVRHAQEAAAIAEVGRDISSTLKLDVVLERIASYARDLLRAETSAVYLTESNTKELRAIATIGVDANEIKSDPIQVGTGILGNIAMQRAGEIVNDTNSDPRAITIKGTESDPYEHIMGVPVLLKDQLTGLLVVWRTGARQEFKSTELDFLYGLAQQAAIAIENARLFHAEQQRRQEAETLREATAVVATTLDRDRAMELILDQLARVLKYDSASIQLLRDGYLEIVGGRGWPADSAVLGLRFPIPGPNPNTVVIQERRPLIIPKINGTFTPFAEEPHSHIHSWMGVPLIAHGEMIGMLSVDSAEDFHFTEEHTRIVTAYANQAAVAIDNAQLHQQSEDQIRRLTALRDVDTAIASSLDLRVTLNILMDNAMSQLHADAMAIMLYNPSLQALESIATIGFRDGAARRQTRIGEGLAGRIAISRKPLQVHDLAEVQEYSRIRWLAEEKFLSYAGYPLLGKGQVKGVLEAFFRTPFTPNADWMEFLQTMAGQAAIAIDNSQLFENLQRSNQELSLAYDTTLEGWGKALELRDKETEGHTRRVTELTIRLAHRMGLDDAEITHLRRGVLLHDIGKMGVPDHILRKTSPLNEEEWELMRRHPQYAYDLLHPITYLRPSLDIPYCHHERWDGSGYPRGLVGEEIPLAARMFTVVDVWDALLSDRPYRKAWPREQIVEYLRNESERRFDPKIVNLFIKMIAEEK